MKSPHWTINLLLFILLAVGLFLGRQQTTKRTEGKTDTLSSLLQNIIYPPTKIIGNTFDNFNNFFNGLYQQKKLQQEVLTLKKQLTLLNYQNSQIKTLQKETDQLRQLIKLNPISSNHSYVGADVIAYFPYENRITLSKGTKDGLHIGAPIINDKGLVGIIDTIENSTAQAILVTSPALKIGGCTQKEPATLGLVKGLHSNALCLEALDKNTLLTIGDAVYTTGLSQKIPANIILGWIIEIQDTPEYGIRKAILKPALNLLHLKEVIVIL